MSLNGKSKSVKSKSPDYMNILYTDSDSDSIPDLKLPQIKGKKHRKRKDASERSEDTCCNFWTVFKVITAIVVFIVWIILAAVSFWSLRQIRELQEHISTSNILDKSYSLLPSSSQTGDHTDKKTEMKGQVDYRLPKKMKKRRQLDALVDTVKLPRPRKNSASVQDLLDSDSSENDEFSLPASGSKRKNRCCVWQSIAAQIGLFMVTTACLTTCVGLVWVQWHIRHELESLRKQVASVENSDKASTELLKFQAQLAEVNTSVMGVKTGQGGLLELANTLAEVQTKVQVLETANKELQASVSASKDLLNLPKKLDALSNTLASLGSDIGRLGKDTQTLQEGHFENRIAALENSMKEKDEAPRITSDKQETASFNETLHSGLQSLRQALDQFSARVSVLEKYTSEPHASTNTAWVTELVSKLLQEKMGNVTVGDQVASNSSQPSQVPAGVLFTDKGEFLAFKADILDNFEKVNETVVILNQELDIIAARLDHHDQALINLTSAVLRGSHPAAVRTPEDVGAEAISSITTTSPPVSMPASSSPQESTTGAGAAGPGIQIKGINSLEDLHKAFNSSWPLEKGQVDVERLEVVGSPVTKSQLKQFDFDGNGLLSEEEMAVALGFHHNPRLITSSR